MRSEARAAAFDILLKVERGGYADDLLRRTELDEREAGLAYQLVFGVLRFQAQLDYFLPQRKLDHEVRIALRLGIYQIRYLERIPRHAAVSESVELVKRARKRSAAGFVNAVLRRIDHAPIEWPDPATALSCPEWLLQRWEAQFGKDAAEAIARAALEQPEQYTRGSRTQDIGSQAIVPKLCLEAGQTFLDLCAAPGNKTAQALESGVRAIACDVHLHRIAQLRGLGIPLLTLDGTKPLPFGRKFERILVDAPCSGTGTLARNPEIKWKLRPQDLPDLQLRQKALLRNATDALAPGGILVYSTCSLEREENEDVVEGYPVQETMRRLPGRDPGDGFFAAVIVNRDTPGERER